jgi:hypothetical protein
VILTPHYSCTYTLHYATICTLHYADNCTATHCTSPRACLQTFPPTHCSCMHSDNKRQELLSARRRNSAPLVVALLPLTAAVDAQHVWSGLLAAAGSSSSSGGSVTTVVAQGRHKVSMTLLKPPADREVRCLKPRFTESLSAEQHSFQHTSALRLLTCGMLCNWLLLLRQWFCTPKCKSALAQQILVGANAARCTFT